MFQPDTLRRTRGSAFCLNTAAEKYVLDRVVIKGGVGSSPDKAMFVPGRVERTCEIMATDTKLYRLEQLAQPFTVHDTMSSRRLGYHSVTQHPLSLTQLKQQADAYRAPAITGQLQVLLYVRAPFA